MKSKKRFETIATIALAFISAALFLRLALRVRAVHAVNGPLAGRQALQRVPAIPRHEAEEAFPEEPALNLEAYQKLQSESLALPDRDPFSFLPTAAQIQAAHARQQAANAAPAGPPPPPPLPFKAVGYSVKAQSPLEAYLADDQQVYVVHAGAEFDKSYRVLKITPAKIEIQDESSGRLVELPFPQ